MTLVALSASYGAGGSRIGPAVAEWLGATFIDRAIPMSAAPGLEVPAEDETGAGGWLERVLRGFVGADVAVPGPVAAEAGAYSEEFRRRSEELLRHQAALGEGVILGRAAVVVLREDPRVLRVRLHGPPERRIEQAVRLFGVERGRAAEAVSKLDRTHDAFLRQFYGVDIHDPALYHLVIDSTALPVPECVEFIVRAARTLVVPPEGSVGVERG